MGHRVVAGRSDLSVVAVTFCHLRWSIGRHMRVTPADGIHRRTVMRATEQSDVHENNPGDEHQEPSEPGSATR